MPIVKEPKGFKGIIKRNKFWFSGLIICLSAIGIFTGTLVLSLTTKNHKNDFTNEYKQTETFINAFDEKNAQIESDYAAQIIDENEYEKQKSHLESFEFVSEVVSEEHNSEVLSKYNAIIKSEKAAKILPIAGNVMNAVAQTLFVTNVVVVCKRNKKERNALINPPVLDLPEDKEVLPEAVFE